MSANTKRWIGIGLLILSMVGVGVWVMKAQHAMKQWDPTEARKANVPIPVRTVKAEKQDLEETVGGTAVTAPARIATITIPQSATNGVDRRVKDVNFWPGSPVKLNEPLMTFEPKLFEQVVRQQEATLKEARQALDTNQKLFDQKAASGLQVETAKVQVETAQMNLDLAKRDLELCVIQSPLNGVVDQLFVVPQMEVPGGTTLAVVTQLDPIYIQMDYPMERLDSLHLDQTAEIVLDAFPQDKFTGKVIRISPVVSTKSRVVPVTIEIPNPDNRIKAGIAGFARVKGVKSATTAVPTLSIIKKQDKSMVICVEEGRAKVREVHTGTMLREGQIEILDGLQPGEEVLVYGQKDVREGDLVNVDWVKWTHRSDLADAAH
jgi:membrane fusion protein (multidrug efflux system)